METFAAFINDNITDSVLGTICNQLFITEVIGIADLNLRITNNPNYIDTVHSSDQRILVKANFSDSLYTTYVEQIDMSLYCRNGLMYVEYNKLGLYNVTYEIKHAQIYNLINKACNENWQSNIC